MTPSEVLDRRAPYHGDRRRTALLSALDELLRERGFDAINVADISGKAGLTRSAFYFYFENKAACAAALSSEMYQEVFTAAENLVAPDTTPRQRIEDTIHGVFAAWESHQYLYRAMLAARQNNESVRQLWDSYRESFVEPVGAMIEAERAAGRAPAGPDGRALATMLLELNDRALERLAADDSLGRHRRAEVLVTIWLRTIFGVTGDEAAAAAIDRSPT